MYCQNLIHKLNPNVNPAGAEAVMRREHGTLDHLPRKEFSLAARRARQWEAMQPGCLREIASEQGLLSDFDAWVKKLS